MFIRLVLMLCHKVFFFNKTYFNLHKDEVISEVQTMIAKGAIT